MEGLKIVGKILLIISLSITGMIIGAICGAFGYGAMGIAKKKLIKRKERQPFEDLWGAQYGL